MLKRAMVVATLLMALPTGASAEPWQSITQPIGTLLVTPPQTALAVNQYLMSLDPNITPATYPFDLRTNVTSIQTSQMLYFVRVYDEASGSRPVGSWIMRASQARGLTPAQIRNIQALPAQPSHFTYVKVPSGIVMYTGVAGAIEGWGDGGATQSKMVGPPYVPTENFINRQPIGTCLLCYRELAAQGNAHQIATVMDRNTPVPYSNLDTVYDNLDRLYFGPTADQFRQALNALSGEGVTASQSVIFDSAASFMETIRQNTTGWFMAALTPGSTAALAGPQGWASLTGGAATLRGNGGTAAVNAAGASLQLGVTRPLSPGVLVGAALGATNSSFSVNDRASHGTVNGLNLSFYGVARSGDLYLAGTLAYGWFNTGLDRNVQVNELLSGQHGSVNTQTLSARLEIGLRTQLAAVNVTPFVSIEPTWLWQGGFSESARGARSGGVNLGLNVQSQQAKSLPASLGLQLDGTVFAGHGWVLQPTLRLSWIHNFSTQRQIDASLQLLPGQPFTVQGAAAPQDTGRLLLGLSGAHVSGVSAYLALDGALSSRSQALGLRAGLAIPF